jgi:hypothetical protein
LRRKPAGKIFLINFPQFVNEREKASPEGNLLNFSRHFPAQEIYGRTQFSCFLRAPVSCKGRGKETGKLGHGRLRAVSLRRAAVSADGEDWIAPITTRTSNTNVNMKNTPTPYSTPAGIVMDEPPIWRHQEGGHLFVDYCIGGGPI